MGLGIRSKSDVRRIKRHKGRWISRCIPASILCHFVIDFGHTIFLGLESHLLVGLVAFIKQVKNGEDVNGETVNIKIASLLLN